MKLEDIIALAKQGYKPSDIKELISLAEEDKKEDSTGTENPDNAGVGEPEDKKPESTPGEDPKTEDIDYKKLYEDAQKQIAAMQKDNVQKDRSDGASDQSVESIIADIARDFM